ncbi:MAG TPA: hypothetical protein VIG33_17950 [Pseudobdellovibrionaceae bacterium]|jgi:hypothetical protein
MKKTIFAMTLLAGFSTHAAQVPVFKCNVPVKTSTPTVSVNVSISDNESVDYITVQLNDKTATNLFMQLEKGSLQKQITAGGVTTLVLGDQFSQGADGVIRDGGVLGLGTDTSGKWSGMLAAKGNVYPLECTKL